MYIFIINPIAGSGRAMKNFSKIQASPLYKEIESRYFLTTYDDHAEKIVKHLVKEEANIKIKTMIVIGGDGTLQEVVNGIVEPHVPNAINPSGQGNDFATYFRQSVNPLTIL